LTDQLGALLATRPALRRLSWRLGRRLYTSARGEQIALEIGSDGEAYLQAQVIANVPSDVRLRVFDIGANQGDWTRHFISLLPDDRRSSERVHVDLFEPIPATRARLAAATLAMADRAVICEVHSAAISNVAGQFKMAIMSDTGGTNSLHFDGSSEVPPGGWASVDTQTIADFCALRGIAHVHLVKCDTEGHDLKVIEGARTLLADGRIDVLQFEYNHRWVFSRSFLKDVFELVKGLPYCLGKLEPRWIEVYDAWHPELERYFQSNYVLVRAPALDWFDVRRGTFDASNTYA
jgi:FkbM family methyltransferase